jgi:predicted PhzF superfamily epimerase YddE/YHI9
MDLPIFWVDAFAERAFGGNPAAVIPLESWPEDSLLQRIANENGLSETAYFVRKGPARAELRWFTPTVEVELCGHATLATAHVLYNELGQVESPFTFDTMSGPLSVIWRAPLIELNFPARSAIAARPAPDLVRALGPLPREVLRSERMWLLVYETADEVIGLTPDHALLANVVPGRIIVTAPGTDCDFVSRFFAPDAGIPEDPVTGAAHCALVPYWAARLGKTRLHARQVSRRAGELWCELEKDRVKIAGHGIAYLKGRITV